MALEWRRQVGAETCPEREEIQREVTERLGRDPFADGGARHIEAELSRREGVWQAELRERSNDGAVVGERLLEARSADCATLSEAVALALALLIDPDRALGSGPLPAQPDAAPICVPCPEPQACPPPPPEPICFPMVCPRCAEPRARRHAVVAAEAVLALGLLPQPAPGAQLGGGLELTPGWRVELGMRFLPEQRSDDRAFGFGLTNGWLGVSADVVSSPARLSLRGGLELGAMHAVVYELEPLEPGAVLWLAAFAGPRLTLDVLPPLAFTLGVDAVVPITRHQYVVRNRPGTVFQAAAVGVVGHAGVVLSWR